MISPIDPTVQVTVDPSLTTVEIEEYWETYDEAFEKIAEFNACLQHWPQDQFIEAMKGEIFIKIICKKDGELVAFCMLTTDFDMVPWIERKFYDEKFPQLVNRRIYVPVIYIPVSLQGAGHFQVLMRGLQTWMTEHNIRVAFYDHGKEGPSGALTKMIETIPNTRSMGTISAQCYDGMENLEASEL